MKQYRITMSTRASRTVKNAWTVIISLSAFCLTTLCCAKPVNGLTVQIGCGKGTSLITMAEDAVVHGLDRSGANVLAARKLISQKKLTGRVNVSVYDGTNLPLIDNTVNTIIVSKGEKIDRKEILRVLVPKGRATLADGSIITKPRPKDIDEWPQYLHDSGNNAVAADSKVGPPNHLQWRAGPRWSRHHDHMSSISAVVTAGGKIYTILDEGSPATILLPPVWKLVARDAFNGLRLWDRSINTWYNSRFKLKSGPGLLPRRLVATDNYVYVTLGLDAAVEVLDSTTGKTVCTLPGTEHAQEILLVGNRVLVVSSEAPTHPEKRLRSNPGVITGKLSSFVDNKPEWSTKVSISGLTLAADEKRIYFHDGAHIIALNPTTGKKLWKSVWSRRYKMIETSDAPMLVVKNNTILFADPQYGVAFNPKNPKEKPQQQGKQKLFKGKNLMMFALDTTNGKKLWEGAHPKNGYRSQGDIFVINDRVWNGPTTSGGFTGIQTARDLRTGEEKKAFPPTVETYWFHHRCYRAKATEKYLMLSRTGIEYIDLKTGNWDINHYVRGACLYGILPANGYTYAPPHPCSCYPETKLDGFVALAAESSLKVPGAMANAKARLEKGPAFKSTPTDKKTASDWPTYRYANSRCGYSPAAVPEKLKKAWTLSLGTQATQPVAAEGKLFVSTPETQSIIAIDAQSGKQLWSFTAGGRADTPPTWYKGRLLFGSTDGYVYCLNAAEGSLIYRFRAAPVDRRQVHFERVESLWPVNGSILVQNDEAIFVAGRTIFLDGGLRFIRINALTGELIYESILDRTDNRTGKDVQDGIQRLNMPVGLPDLLGSDGKRIFMRSEVLDINGQRVGKAPHTTEPARVVVERPEEDSHLFAPSGYADDSWWHRTYWSYGSTFPGGHDGYYQSGRFTPSGRILVHDEDKVYGFCRDENDYRWTSTLKYHMFKAPRAQVKLGPEQQQAAFNKKGKNVQGKRYFVNHEWKRPLPILLRGLAGAGKYLILAGPPDKLDEREVWKTGRTEKTTPQGMAQQDSIDGKLGGMLLVTIAESGETVGKVALESPPVFDGVIAAQGAVFMSALDGTIRCYR